MVVVSRVWSCPASFDCIRDRSLIAGVGGVQNGSGGKSSFSPIKNGEVGKVLAMLKRGGHQCLG